MFCCENKYCIVVVTTTATKDFWMPILKQKSFRDFIENKYRVAAGEIMSSNIEETFDVETMNGAW